MERLGKLTRQLESTVGRLLGTETGDGREPLELVTGILREVERRVEPIGGGRRRLPYTDIAIVVLAERQEDQDRCAAALDDLTAKIRERLAELDCEPPVRLDATVQFARKPRKHWSEGQRVELQFSRDTAAAALPASTSTAASKSSGAPATALASASSSSSSAAAASSASAASAAAASASASASSSASVPSVRIAILRGTGVKRTYALKQPTIRLGRGAEHADASGGTRHNDIAFVDDHDDVNRTVARAQAHLRFYADRGEFRLFDDGSSNGTRIVRNAEIITITPHGPRGVRVLSGDIIELGRARVRIDLDA